MNQPAEIQIEDLLVKLADICRDAGLMGYDQVIISLGLLHLFSNHQYNQENHDQFDFILKERYNQIEFLEELAYKKFGLESSSRDIEEQFITSLRKVRPSELSQLLYVIADVDFSGLYHENVINILKQFIARSLMSGRYSSYYVSNFQLGGLFRKIIDIKPGDRVYDPAAGLGIMMSFLDLVHAKEIIFQDRNQQVIVLAKLFWRFISNSENTSFFVGDSLIRPSAEERSIDILIGELPFGKSGKMDKYMLDPSIWVPSSDLPELFVQLSVSRLSSTGKAFLLIPDGFLFNRSRSSKAVKSHLVDQDLIECIISFPTGFLKPYSGVKTSLLILNRNKPPYRKDEVLFIDAENDEEIGDRYSPSKIDIERIARIYYTQTVRPEEHVIQIGNWELADNDFDLQVKRYLRELQLNLAAQLKPGESFKKLRDLITPITTKRNRLDDIPYVKVRDLANDPFEANLSIENWRVLDEQQKGRKLEESALLAARVGEKLKPSYFEFKGDPIAVNANIFAFKIDQGKLDTDYLIFELSSDYFKDQLKSITSGTAQPAWSKKDFLELVIKVPSLAQQKESLVRQKEIAKQKKEALIEQKKQEIELLKDRLQVEDKGLEIISNFKHDFMGNLERISSGLSVLRNFLKEKDESEEIVKLSDPIIEVIDDDPTETLSEWLERLYTNVKNAINTLEHEIEQIKEDRESYHFEVENIYHLLRQIKKKYPSNQHYQIRVERGLGVEEVKELRALVDKNKFEVAIDNLITNAIKHGFEKKAKKNYLLIFEVDLITEDETTYLMIKYKNNGLPLPKDFTFDDFVQRGKKAGKNGRSGIGGDRISRIVRRHKGIFRESIQKGAARELTPFNINFEILIPQSLD